MTMDDWSRREFIATGLSADVGLLIAAATVSREHGSDARSVVEEPDGALVNSNSKPTRKLVPILVGSWL